MVGKDICLIPVFLDLLRLSLQTDIWSARAECSMWLKKNVWWLLHRVLCLVGLLCCSQSLISLLIFYLVVLPIIESNIKVHNYYCKVISLFISVSYILFWDVQILILILNLWCIKTCFIYNARLCLLQTFLMWCLFCITLVESCSPGHLVHGVSFPTLSFSTYLCLWR